MTNNLPASLTSFLGREAELETLRQLLSREVRLVTITGPGGVGKTSLALHVARAVQDDFADGVFFIPLAPIIDPTLVIPTIAHALSLPESPNRLMLASLKDYLQGRHVLLLLDNFEQFITVAPLLTELLSACDRLQLLVTSREALRLRGEQEFLLSPLALPDKPAAGNLLQYPGIALFVERAQAASLEFHLTPQNATAVTEICSRLDGLPLAIELAAARIKLFSPQAMLTQLQDSPLELLAGGARDLPSRQQTMRCTVQWSYDLLDGEEQRAFRGFSVFVGGSTLAAALAVLGPPASLDVLDSLVNKSLLRSVETNGAPRLIMLWTIREFGWEQLAQMGEREAVRRAAASYYLSLAEEAEGELAGANQKDWLRRLDREQDNLRSALQWALEQHEGELARRMAGALQPFWFRRGLWSEGRRWLEDSLAIGSGSALNQSVLANALYGAGLFTRFQGDFARARVLCGQSLEIYRTLADQQGVLKTLAQLCRITNLQADLEDMQAFMTEAASLIETLPDSVVRADAYTDLALAMLDISVLNFHPEANRYLAESERIHRALSNQSGLALAALHRGLRALFEGDYSLALSRFDEAERLAMELGDVRLLSRTAGSRALLDLHEGDFTAARRRLETSILEYYSMGDHQLYSNLTILAVVLHKQGLDVWAVRVLGMTGVLFGSRLSNLILAAYEQRMHLGDIHAALRLELGSEAFAREMAAGRGLTLDDLRTIPYPLEHVQVVPPSAPGVSLTGRENEVLHLLARELSNPQIAKVLVVSRRTVDAHLRSIYDKLGVKSRDAAIRMAREQGLLGKNSPPVENRQTE